jgi:anti-sigma factor RsiW
MHDEMRTLLNAYLDGEVHGRRLRELEFHLAACEACQNELKELHEVSALLQADPAPEFIPTERFVAQVTLNLPRRTLRSQPAKPGSPAWWLVPAGLIGAWFFLQTVFILSDAVTAAKMTGLLGHAFNWMAGSSQETLWFSAAISLFSGQVSALPTLSLLNNIGVISLTLLGGFLIQAAIVLLYWAWLYSWWRRTEARGMKTQNLI